MREGTRASCVGVLETHMASVLPVCRVNYSRSKLSGNEVPGGCLRHVRRVLRHSAKATYSSVTFLLVLLP